MVRTASGSLNFGDPYEVYNCRQVVTSKTCAESIKTRILLQLDNRPASCTAWSFESVDLARQNRWNGGHSEMNRWIHLTVTAAGFKGLALPLYCKIYFALMPEAVSSVFWQRPFWARPKLNLVFGDTRPLQPQRFLGGECSRLKPSLCVLHYDKTICALFWGLLFVCASDFGANFYPVEHSIDSSCLKTFSFSKKHPFKTPNFFMSYWFDA